MKTLAMYAAFGIGAYLLTKHLGDKVLKPGSVGDDLMLPPPGLTVTKSGRVLNGLGDNYDAFDAAPYQYRSTVINDLTGLGRDDMRGALTAAQKAAAAKKAAAVKVPAGTRGATSNTKVVGPVNAGPIKAPSASAAAKKAAADKAAADKAAADKKKKLAAEKAKGFQQVAVDGKWTIYKGLSPADVYMFVATKPGASASINDGGTKGKVGTLAGVKKKIAAYDKWVASQTKEGKAKAAAAEKKKIADAAAKIAAASGGTNAAANTAATTAANSAAVAQQAATNATYSTQQAAAEQASMSAASDDYSGSVLTNSADYGSSTGTAAAASNSYNAEAAAAEQASISPPLPESVTSVETPSAVTYADEGPPAPEEAPKSGATGLLVGGGLLAAFLAFKR